MARKLAVLSTLPLVKARYVLETETWDVKPVTEKSSTHELLATAISAYHAGDNTTLGKGRQTDPCGSRQTSCRHVAVQPTGQTDARRAA